MGKDNINIRQCNMYLNSKSWKKAGDVTIYKYKNSWREKKALEKYFIPGRIG